MVLRHGVFDFSRDESGKLGKACGINKSLTGERGKPLVAQMKPKTLLARTDLAPMRKAFERVCRLSRLWNRIVQRGIARFGERPQGGHVSGIYSEHFPQRWQNRLRNIAEEITRAANESHALRPSRVRSHTVRELKLAVKARDGSGYYG